MLREYGRRHGLNLEAYARICERHTGTGITAEEIRNQKLPVPERDYLPETPEEKLVCLADKFYSKSGGMKEKSISRIRQSMLKFGVDSVARLEEMCRMFGVMDDEYGIAGILPEQNSRGFSKVIKKRSVLLFTNP